MFSKGKSEEFSERTSDGTSGGFAEKNSRRKPSKTFWNISLLDYGRNQEVVPKNFSPRVLSSNAPEVSSVSSSAGITDRICVCNQNEFLQNP